MKRYEFTIMGDPFGKQRPRATIRGGHIHIYTPQETKDYEARVREAATRQVRMITVPVVVDIKAYFKIPKYFSKKKKRRCLAGLERPTKKPDKDNIEKIVLDGMNPLSGVNKATRKRVVKAEGLYLDDKQVIAGKTTKLYGEPARVEVVVTEFEA
ncbi:RusA family crossover junction endodeoxyribonuclease [Lactobacillus sp. ESL0679]|uniref:RusA family crossover junction endodeoxyribonuclease n=1 Tax=Lactobacillus sp. ESL0679 TaxID=2983209 RepID=UPI0023F716CB|nr:RusA family crossover junction endodeoxyribonuclease [Lactobacillus sp. ESL0679]MDF7683392.1 RusA family crossover junction endodeoxyribonuclease [Lactobacillus sp. ESL0679]